MNVAYYEVTRDCPNCGNVVEGELSPRIDLTQSVGSVLAQLGARRQYVYNCRWCGYTNYWTPEQEVCE